MRAVLAIVTASLVLMSAGSSHADDDDYTPLPMQPMSSADAPHVNPWVAFGLSAAGAGAGYGMAALGARRRNDALVATGLVTLAIGPSFGHWYSGRWWSPGMIARAAGAAVIGSAFVVEATCHSEDDGCLLLESFIVPPGVLLIGAGILADVVAAPIMASEENRKRDQLRLTATMVPASDGPAPGFALSGTF